MVRRVAADRPVLVAQALLGGATSEQVASVIGMDLIELRAAVGRWATWLRQEGRLTELGFTELVNVVFGPAG